ncbi:MAG TPA: hypothetical protein VFZ41_04130, partial [Solirubrobacterales bacterium]
MRRKGQPINADVPAQATGEPESGATTAAEATRAKLPVPAQAREPVQAPTAATTPAPPAPPRQRKTIPAALKAIGTLVVIAVVFIVAAIVGGGSEDGDSIPGAAPTPEPPTTTEAPPPRPPSELGYPEFATNNTTRIGGGDPASNAAAVALAVYPSRRDAQRPRAVTLVNEDDWQSAIAAAVLMAEPLRAPLLISGPDELPDPTSDALDALDPPGGRSTRRARAFAVGGAAAPSGLRATTVAGGGAAGAAAIARLRDRLFGGPPRHILVAPSAQPSFAMPAAAWAARSGDPVLFAEVNRLPEPTVSLLKRHRGVPVYVFGPSSAISSQVVRRIAAINPRVSRVSGEDPVENAIALARYDDGDFGWNVNDPGHGLVVARADSILDAVAAAPLSASGTWGPLLL